MKTKKLALINDFETIEQYVEYFHNMEEREREAIFSQDIIRCRRLWQARGTQYCKKTLTEGNGHCIQLMFWAPEGKTRPHEHLYPDEVRGAPATIYILRGTLTQDLFGILDEDYMHLQSNKHGAWDEPIFEDHSAIHRIGNPSLREWAVSIHEFVPGFKMRVYDFGLNLQWVVEGTQDTLGPPPKDAEPIWPR